MKKIKLKTNQSGITLIALVITIVVLLILAGIAIVTLTGKNGLLNKAKVAKESYVTSKKDEEDKLNEYSKFIENRGDVAVIEGTGGTGGLDIQDENLINWINCLDDKSISLEDITKGNLLDKLMNNKKAVDYMLSNETIYNSVLDSSIAMQKLGASEYGGYAVIMNPTARTKLLASKYISFFDENSTQIPKLTDDTYTIYSARASGETSGYKVFDKSTSTYWWTPNTTNTEYVGYNFQKKVVPYKVSVVNLDSTGYRAKTFYMSFSTDNSDFSKKTSDYVLQQNSNYQTFILDNICDAQYVRINIKDKYKTGEFSTGICELQVYARNIPE